MILFILGAYTSLALASFTIMTWIARSRHIAHWISITLAATAWPITLMMIMAT